jgi:hypothetical protein
MGLFAKIFIGFWVIWIIWYVTGGPLRDDKSKPFIGPTGSGQLEKFGTSTRP